MLKPLRGGLVPWGLPGPTRGRRDAAAFKLASKTKPPSQGPGTQAARMEGPSRGGARAGPGPTGTDYTSLHLCTLPDGLGRRNGPLVSI